nr:MAG TPA: hypothetical protein [Caudoviricetes sp.]
MVLYRRQRETSVGLNNLKKEKEQGEILALFLLHDIKNNYNKTLEKILTNQT